MRKSLLEEVQELEARAVDPGAAVLRDASGRRYMRYSAKHHGIPLAFIPRFIVSLVDFSYALCHLPLLFLMGIFLCGLLK